MAESVLPLRRRAARGKGAARAARARGELPAVLYGPGRGAEPVAVDARAAQLVVERLGTGHLLQARLGDEPEPRTVLIKEVQRDPVRGALLHLDFYEVPMDRKVAVTVPLHLVGEDRRPPDGGILQHGLRELTIRCLPARIPDAIEVDVSRLAVGEALRVADLRVPEGVEVLDDPAEILVLVVLPSRAAAGQGPGAGGSPAGEAGAGGTAAAPGEKRE